MSELRYEIWTAPADLASYRPQFTPRAGELEVCGFWPCQALVGASGKRYWFMLTVGDANRPIVQVSDASVIPDPGFRRTSSPVLIEGMELRRHHRYEYQDGEREVTYRFRTDGYLRMDPRSYDWRDFGGAIDLHVRQVGEAVYFRIPVQDRITHPIYHQSQTGLVTGEINGDAVFGLSLLDFVWTTPRTSWLNTEAFRKIERHWSMWLVEYEDGTFDGGYAWSAKEPFTFNAGHLIRNEVSSACQTAKSTVRFSAIGLPQNISIDYGGQYGVELEFTHLADWPLHPVGHVASTSAAKPIKRSIAITEWIPDNISDLLDGKVPGCRSYLDMNVFDSVIRNHCLVPAESR